MNGTPSEETSPRIVGTAPAPLADSSASDVASPGARFPLWPVVVTTVVLLITEAWLKQWAIQTLSPGVDRVALPGVLHLGFTLNTGMAWGLLGGLTLPLALLRVGVGGALLVVIGLRRCGASQVWPLAFLAAGALGNGLDGLARGAVVDYLTSPLLDAVSRGLTGRAFPIFNLSDVLVCTGAVWLVGQTAWRERSAGHFASAGRDSSKES